MISYKSNSLKYHVKYQSEVIFMMHKWDKSYTIHKLLKSYQ